MDSIEHVTKDAINTSSYYSEGMAILIFFLWKGGYSKRSGSTVWKSISSEEIFQGQAWDSIKEQWEGQITMDLIIFGISDDAVGAVLVVNSDTVLIEVVEIVEVTVSVSTAPSPGRSL